MRLIYVSGKYSGKNHEEIHQNIMEARKWAIEIWKLGYVAICPHLLTYHFEDDIHLDHEEYIRRDLAILRRCDGLFACPNWKDSPGAREEVDFAEATGIPIYYDLKQLEPFHIDPMKAAIIGVPPVGGGCW